MPSDTHSTRADSRQPEAKPAASDRPDSGPTAVRRTKSDKDLLREFAHEIRNPLNAMLGYSAMIKGDDGMVHTREQTVDYAGRVYNATKRLLEVCERVLDEAVRGERIVRKEPVKFDTFCSEVVATFAAEAQLADVDLSYEIAADFPVLETDPIVLYEVMSNLIGNAVKFTPPKGKVTVRGEVNYKNEALMLIVQDTGKGIPTTIIRSIMKGAQTTTTFDHSHRKGWGQGMQTAMEKVKLLGGEMDIESAMGGGTVVCVRLPWTETVEGSPRGG